jgi:hypothetical protein
MSSSPPVAAHPRELASLQRRLGEQVDGLNTRVAELDAENRRLREAKYELDKQVSERWLRGVRLAIAADSSRPAPCGSSITTLFGWRQLACCACSTIVACLLSKTCGCCGLPASQVSELSHRLGSSEGSNKALEEEVARLRSDTITAAQERAQREAAAAELKSKLLALEEKVRG